MRLIDAEQMKKKLNEWIDATGCDVFTKYHIMEFLNDCDAVEAVPVVHGEWVGTRYDGFADGYPVYDEWECSVCGEEYESEGEPPTCNFCPNCGAKFAELN